MEGQGNVAAGVGSRGDARESETLSFFITALPFTVILAEKPEHIENY